MSTPSVPRLAADETPSFEKSEAEEYTNEQKELLRSIGNTAHCALWAVDRPDTEETADKAALKKVMDAKIITAEMSKKEKRRRLQTLRNAARALCDDRSPSTHGYTLIHQAIMSRLFVP